jgi:hypothetical protein
MRIGTVKSTRITAIGHEGTTLRVKFRDGVACDYAGVPFKIFKEFVDAESKGKFLDAVITKHYAHTCK